MLFLCSIVSLPLVMHSGDDVQLCFLRRVQLCPFQLRCILVMMMFLCSIVSLSLVMYSGDDAVSMFNSFTWW